MQNLMAAFLKAQQEFPTVVKDAMNPAFRSKYATLGAVQDAAFPVLHKHGLVAFQAARSELTDKGLMVYVAATLCHVESGEMITQELGVMPGKQDPQGVGSALSYLRRYTLMTMLGLVADDDDDGNAAAQVAPNRTGAPQNRTNVPQGSTTPPATQKPGLAPPAQPQGTPPPAALRQTLHTTAVARFGSPESWQRNQQAAALWASGDRTDDLAQLSDAEIRRILTGWAKKDAQSKQPPAREMKS